MCTAPVIDEEWAAANAAPHANTIKEINAVVTHVTARSNPSYLLKAQNTLWSIVMPTKRAQFVDVHDISSYSASSMASVGSAIDHAAKIAKADANAFDLNNYTTSV
jgi:hypothetical protein